MEWPPTTGPTSRELRCSRLEIRNCGLSVNCGNIFNAFCKSRQPHFSLACTCKDCKGEGAKKVNLAHCKLFLQLGQISVFLSCLFLNTGQASREAKLFQRFWTPSLGFNNANVIFERDILHSIRVVVYQIDQKKILVV